MSTNSIDLEHLISGVYSILKNDYLKIISYQDVKLFLNELIMGKKLIENYQDNLITLEEFECVLVGHIYTRFLLEDFGVNENMGVEEKLRVIVKESIK